MELHAEKESPSIKSQKLLEAKPVKPTIQHEQQFQQPKGHEKKVETV